MTISRNNSGSDSRVVRALVEQVSQIQEDINVIDGRIDDLDRDKAETSDLAVSVNTQGLTADNATIGGSTTINTNGLYSPNLDASYLHSQNADFNYVHSNVGYIESLTTDALTVNGATNTFDLNAERVKVTETIDVPSLNADIVNANAISVNGNVSALGITADSANYNVVNLQKLDVAQSLNVRDLNITGNISGLNNVDIVANSITTPIIEADEIKAGAVYTLETSDDYHLVPTPHLDNNDHYTIQLPSFTGTVVLNWVDDHANKVWSATVIGDGKDYEIHWGTLGETLVVQKIYQYDGSLYIRHNANGSLYYSYHTTEKLGDIAIWYNYTALDTVVQEDYTHDCIALSGTVSFGDFYAPGFAVETSVVDDLLVRGTLDINNLTVNGVAGSNGQVLGIADDKVNWLDVTSYVMMDESEYNNLPRSEKKKPIFYLTQPNGNLYLQMFGYSPSYLPPAIYSVWANLFQTRTDVATHSLELGNADVTNAGNFSVYGVQKDDVWVNSLSVNVNATGNTLYTTANELYIYDASNLYNGCRYLTDTFICNPALITNAPGGYDPMMYCVNMSYTFHGCMKFNQPITIPNGVTNMYNTFSSCDNFNQPVTIPDSVTNMYSTFEGCRNFNHPITIPNSVTEMSMTFRGCGSFNQPITIPNGVTSMSYTFYDCHNFNSPVIIGNNVTDMDSTFSGCDNFNHPITIPNSVTEMSMTFRGCWSFNSPVIIGNNVTDMADTFTGCTNFNQPVTIPNGVTNMYSTFCDCHNFNQPVTIPNNVTKMGGTFYDCESFNSSVIIGNSVTDMEITFSGCTNFNQPITIPDSVTEMHGTFASCTTLEASTVPIHISSSIALGDTSNYIYNCLINGECGITFDPSRILNDA